VQQPHPPTQNVVVKGQYTHPASRIHRKPVCVKHILFNECSVNT